MAEGDGDEVEWLDDFVQSIRQIHEQALLIGGGAPGELTCSLYRLAPVHFSQPSVKTFTKVPGRGRLRSSSGSLATTLLLMATREQAHWLLS